MNDTIKTKNKVIEFRSPDELEKLFPFSLDNKASNNEQLLNICKNVLKYSVNCIHPHFHNQLFSGVNQYALAGEFISTTTNGSMYT